MNLNKILNQIHQILLTELFRIISLELVLYMISIIRRKINKKTSKPMSLFRRYFHLGTAFNHYWDRLQRVGLMHNVDKLSST